MLKQIKLGLLAVLAVAFLASCQNEADSARDAAVDNATAGTATPPPPPPPAADASNVVPTANANTPAAPAGPTTKMTFNETEFNFGTVKAGEKVRHEYKFKNTGDEPLIISNAKGSCGCTVPEWPKEPIGVGEEGSIMVQFDSKNKKGNQTKQVTITANTDPPQSIIYIKGEVLADEKTPTVTPTAQ